LRKATVFAAYKIGERGASLGFLPEDELQQLFAPFGISTGQFSSKNPRDRP
jgi:hypothetical protein